MRATKTLRAFVVLSALVALAGEARADQSFTIDSTHNGWIWQPCYVYTNSIVTLAVIPSIGAHIMQYDVGSAPTLWVTDLRLTPPMDSTTWGNYGGFKDSPAPQSAWNWPPPAYLDRGQYTVENVAQSTDSVVMTVASPVEAYHDSAYGLQYKRVMTFYQGTSHVRIDQHLLNKGNTRSSWAIWGIAPVIGSHDDLYDYDNFWVYYPRKSGLSASDPAHVRLTGTADAETLQVRQNVAPGVDALHFQAMGVKIGINTDRGWLAYVDELNGTAFVIKAPYSPSGTYPDSQSVFEINASSSPAYMEIEPLGPLTHIALNDSSTLAIDWFATRMHGPIVSVNNAGAVARHLQFNADGTVSGAYGVFYSGTVKVKVDSDTATVQSLAVSPLDSLLVSADVYGTGTHTVSLLLYDSYGRFVDTLDRATGVLAVTTSPKRVEPVTFAVDRSSVRLHLPGTAAWELSVVDLCGTVVRSMRLTAGGERRIALGDLPRGLYVVSVRSGDQVLSRPLLLSAR